MEQCQFHGPFGPKSKRSSPGRTPPIAMDPVHHAMALPGIAMRILAFQPTAIWLVPLELRKDRTVREVWLNALIQDPPPLVWDHDTDELACQAELFLDQIRPNRMSWRTRPNCS